MQMGDWIGAGVHVTIATATEDSVFCLCAPCRHIRLIAVFGALGRTAFLADKKFHALTILAALRQRIILPVTSADARIVCL